MATSQSHLSFIFSVNHSRIPTPGPQNLQQTESKCSANFALHQSTSQRATHVASGIIFQF